MQGWGRAIIDPARPMVDDLRERIEQHRATGTELFAPYFYAILAEAALAAKEMDTVAEALDRAEQSRKQSGEGWWAAEIRRLRGLYELAREGDESEATKCFEDAISDAQESGARSLALRAATSLAARAAREDDDQETRKTLARIYDGFTEGFETKDLKDASLVIEKGL